MRKAREWRQQAQWCEELAKTAEDVFTKEALAELASELRGQADELEQTEIPDGQPSRTPRGPDGPQ
jgi:hypothetical protein